MGALFLDMDQVVAFLKENPSSWTLGPNCEIESDPGQWGHSLANNAEILLPCLDAVGVARTRPEGQAVERLVDALLFRNLDLERGLGGTAALLFG